MASKYVDTSATYCGDGTSSAQAASAGATGAWNDILDAFAGTPDYGTLAAGDHVYIRTKDASHANMSLTATGNIAFGTTATVTAPIVWEFDNGSVWSEGGVFTFNMASYGVNFTDFNHVKCYSGNWKVLDTSGEANGASNNSFNLLSFASQIIDGIQWEFYATSSKWTGTTAVQANKRCVLLNPIINVFKNFSYVYAMIRSGAGSYLKLVNAQIDYGSAYVTESALFYIVDYARVEVLGGKVYNSLASRYISYNWLNYAASNLPYFLNFDGFDPGLLTYLNLALVKAESPPTIVTADTIFFRLNNIPGGKFDFWEETGGNETTWRYGQSFPTLNAQLPDFSTPWSIRCCPRYAKSSAWTAPSLKLSKSCSLAEDVRDITIELLINTSYTDIQGNDWFAHVTYVDATTGLSKGVSTWSSASLTSSTAAWSSTSYGGETYAKYKIVCTTPTAIKQYTAVTVEVNCGRSMPTTTSYYFVDPDIGIA